ncbi:MAG TPA: hypothetical protein VFB12_04570 [Ktedonobacteraceae bacterium]|nr:hypothetical protein [Ktedonobacteraceae bacterium]
MIRCRQRFYGGLQLCLSGLLLLLMLAGCGLFGTGSTPAGATAVPAIAFDKQQGHVLIQLFRVPGNIYPPINGVPDWTLYGDGTLIFKSNNGSLQQARLSASDIQHILDVVVQENTFFASNQALYGRMFADMGSLLLTVNANGQHKTVRLFAEPDSTADEQTQHVFAIKNFLLNYHPASVQAYSPPGAVLLVIPRQTGDAPVWPYNDIQLAQIAAQECPYLPFGGREPCTNSGSTGLYPVYGQRGLELLTRWPLGTIGSVSQSGQDYQVIIWPLMPDALVPQGDNAPGVHVEGTNAGTWPLLAGYGKKP